MSKQSGFSSVVLGLVVLGLISLMASPAAAVKEFKDAFKAKYVKEDSSAANEKALAQAFDQAGCAVCHSDEDKKVRNDYGKQIAKLVTKKDKKDKTKIQTALDTVAKLKCNPTDPKSPTFGEKISSGKLPAAK